MLIFFTFQHVIEGGIISNLTFVITQSLILQRVLILEELGERLICFGIDGTIFLGLSH